MNKELATVRLKGAYYWYPMFYFGGPRCSVDGFDETRTELGELFAEIGQICCPEKFDWKDSPRKTDGDPEFPYLFERPDVRYPKAKGDSYAKRADYPASEGNACYHSLYGKIESRTLEVLRALWDRTARFAEMAYLGGVQDGRNVLMQLSTGQLSGADLQKQDVALARDVQNARHLHRKLGRRAS